MKHSELINLILRELEKNDISLHTYREIHDVFLPNEDFSSYRSNWSNWIRGKAQQINNAKAKKIIQKTIGFEGYIWDADEKTQISTIRQAVKNYANPAPKVDLTPLLPKNTPLSDAQIDTLIKIRKSSIEKSKEILDKSNFLKALPENQIFLLKLLSLLFEKGMYDYLIESVFPMLLPHNAEHNSVKIFKAHTYGSLEKPEYLKAVFLLQTISTDSQEQALEVQTGLLSNLRRHALEKDNLTKEELIEALPVFIRYYTEIFENIEKYHYYPGTNLMYLLKIYMLISPDTKGIDIDDMQAIYKNSRPSISKDAHNSSEEISYYAKMSEIEFHLLLGINDTDSLLANLLEIDTPSASYVKRTIRMMQFYVRVIEKFSINDSVDECLRFKEVIEILKGYVREKSELNHRVQ